MLFGFDDVTMRQEHESTRARPAVTYVSCCGFSGFLSCPHREQSHRFTTFFRENEHSFAIPFNLFFHGYEYLVRVAFYQGDLKSSGIRVGTYQIC
jgi:hypothetical protein